MKNFIFTAMALCACVICGLPAASRAGTLAVGGSIWAGQWDSALEEPGAENANSLVIWRLGNPPYSDTDLTEKTTRMGTCRGVLLGPDVSYQTADERWSFRASFLVLNALAQKATATFANSGNPISARYMLVLDRREVDASVERTFFERWRLYAGYTFQASQNEISADLHNSGYVKLYRFSSMVHAPCAGAGYVAPVSTAMSLGVRLGLLYVIPRLKSKIYVDHDDTVAYDSGNVPLKNAPGFNGEIFLAYRASESVLLRGGYRYQRVKFESRDRGGLNEWDTFQGVTLSAVYLWPLGE